MLKFREEGTNKRREKKEVSTPNLVAHSRVGLHEEVGKSKLVEFFGKEDRQKLIEKRDVGHVRAIYAKVRETRERKQKFEPHALDVPDAIIPLSGSCANSRASTPGLIGSAPPSRPSSPGYDESRPISARSTGSVSARVSQRASCLEHPGGVKKVVKVARELATAAKALDMQSNILEGFVSTNRGRAHAVARIEQKLARIIKNLHTRTSVRRSSIGGIGDHSDFSAFIRSEIALCSQDKATRFLVKELKYALPAVDRVEKLRRKGIVLYGRLQAVLEDIAKATTSEHLRNPRNTMKEVRMLDMQYHTAVNALKELLTGIGVGKSPQCHLGHMTTIAHVTELVDCDKCHRSYPETVDAKRVWLCRECPIPYTMCDDCTKVALKSSPLALLGDMKPVRGWDACLSKALEAWDRAFRSIMSNTAAASEEVVSIAGRRASQLANLLNETSSRRAGLRSVHVEPGVMEEDGELFDGAESSSSSDLQEAGTRTSRLIFKNLSRTITAEKLKSVCSDFGRVAHVDIEQTSRAKPNGIVDFETQEEACTALRWLDGQGIEDCTFDVHFDGHADPNLAAEIRALKLDSRTLRIAGLSADVDQEHLYEFLHHISTSSAKDQQAGLVSVTITKEDEQCIGLVEFANARLAYLASQAINGRMYESQQLECMVMIDRNAPTAGWTNMPLNGCVRPLSALRERPLSALRESECGTGAEAPPTRDFRSRTSRPSEGSTFVELNVQPPTSWTRMATASEKPKISNQRFSADLPQCEMETRKGRHWVASLGSAARGISDVRVAPQETPPAGVGSSHRPESSTPTPSTKAESRANSRHVAQRHQIVSNAANADATSSNTSWSRVGVKTAAQQSHSGCNEANDGVDESDKRSSREHGPTNRTSLVGGLGKPSLVQLDSPVLASDEFHSSGPAGSLQQKGYIKRHVDISGVDESKVEAEQTLHVNDPNLPRQCEASIRTHSRVQNRVVHGRFWNVRECPHNQASYFAPRFYAEPVECFLPPHPSQADVQSGAEMSGLRVKEKANLARRLALNAEANCRAQRLVDTPSAATDSHTCQSEDDSQSCDAKSTAAEILCQTPSLAPQEYLVAPVTPRHGAGQLDLQVWRATVSTWKARAAHHQAKTRAATADLQQVDENATERAGSAASCPASFSMYASKPHSDGASAIANPDTWCNPSTEAEIGAPIASPTSDNMFPPASPLRIPTPHGKRARTGNYWSGDAMDKRRYQFQRPQRSELDMTIEDGPLNVAPLDSNWIMQLHKRQQSKAPQERTRSVTSSRTVDIWMAKVRRYNEMPSDDEQTSGDDASHCGRVRAQTAFEV